MIRRSLGRFDAEELAVLAELLTVSRWPFPLQVRSGAPTENDARRAHLDARERLTAGGVLRGHRVEPDLEGALRTLHRPVVRVDVTGISGPRPPDAVRLLAAHSGGVAVLAEQEPGGAEHVGGDVTLTVHPRAALPAVVAHALWSALPPAPTGRVVPLAVARGDLASQQAEARVALSAARTPDELARHQLQALSRGPFSTAGQVAVTRMAAGSREDRRCTRHWFDVTGDGRYLVDSSRGIAVTPADQDTIADALGRQLAP